MKASWKDLEKSLSSVSNSPTKKMRGVQMGLWNPNSAKTDKWLQIKKRRKWRAPIFKMRQGNPKKVDRTKTGRWTNSNRGAWDKTVNLQSTHSASLCPPFVMLEPYSKMDSIHFIPSKFYTQNYAHWDCQSTFQFSQIYAPGQACLRYLPTMPLTSCLVGALTCTVVHCHLWALIYTHQSTELTTAGLK